MATSLSMSKRLRLGLDTGMGVSMEQVCIKKYTLRPKSTFAFYDPRSAALARTAFEMSTRLITALAWRNIMDEEEFESG